MDAITPKGHAKIIFDKLCNLASIFGAVEPERKELNAKQSGMLFCDEMLRSIDNLKDSVGKNKEMSKLLKSLRQHWASVKTEIQKL